MYYKEMIAAIARKLPHRTRQDVAEVVEILGEVCADELVAGGHISLPELGRLSIDVHQLRASGAVKTRSNVNRICGRFRPTSQLKTKILEGQFE